MNTTRNLLAASLAFATLGAFAHSAPDFSTPSASMPSSLTRAQVRQEAADAQRMGLIPSGEAGSLMQAAQPMADKSRAEVRADLLAAERRGLLRFGEALN